MRAFSTILVILLLAAVCQAQSPGGNDWREVGESDEWVYFAEWGSITNDNFYSRWQMKGVHKTLGTEVPFEVECKKGKKPTYRTIGAGKVSVTSNSYSPIPPGSVIEAVFMQVKDLRRGTK